MISLFGRVSHSWPQLTSEGAWPRWAGCGLPHHGLHPGDFLLLRRPHLRRLLRGPGGQVPAVPRVSPGDHCQTLSPVMGIRYQRISYEMENMSFLAAWPLNALMKSFSNIDHEQRNAVHHLESNYWISQKYRSEVICVCLAFVVTLWNV